MSLNKTKALYVKRIKADPTKKDNYKAKLGSLEVKKNAALRGLFKSSGDFLTSSKGAGEFVLIFRVCGESRDYVQ
jgi:hypothetical protein